MVTRNKRECKEQFMLFDLFKAFDYISIQIGFFFESKSKIMYNTKRMSPSDILSWPCCGLVLILILNIWLYKKK